ncbi:protein draper-like isoform X2 [Mytilus californianus]|uniref:protein draper-like isoform X2 n=1 Tax=Mytilus californianus TaxID=6549 RepID=UPI00224601BC|nr:protein draper-like isoform X2 [Mytilus californianus]
MSLFYTGVLCLFLCISIIYCSNGICFRFTKNLIKQFCCDNFELRDGICVECEHGFSSFDGKLCKPCQEGFYGRKCFNRCICRTIERCDSVEGCLRVLPSTEAVTTDGHIEGTSTALATTAEIKNKTGKDKSQIPIPLIVVTSTVLILLLCIALIWIYWKLDVLFKREEKISERSNIIHYNESANQLQLGETD